MQVFRKDGHLTDNALSALAQNHAFDTLTRLEIAEHLSYCDLCLERYTQRLTGAELLVPENDCRNKLWQRIRQQTLRLFTKRYATAAAAIALALTMLWSDAATRLPASAPPSLPEFSLTEQCSEVLENVGSGMRNIFESFESLREGERP